MSSVKSVFERKGLPASDETFESLKSALERLPLGRWFLEEAGRRARAEGFAEVTDEIRSLRDTVESNRKEGRLDILEQELCNMQQVIAQARSEIAEIRPEGPSSDRIMAATEELDAIVVATERATSDILGAAEAIQNVSGKLRSAKVDESLIDRIDTEIISIFTACSFQDITGQRITKVVNVLRYLEQRVNTMIEIWGVGSETTAREGDAALLNGPALEGDGVSQDDIDSLLNGDMDNSDIDEMFAAAG